MAIWLGHAADAGLSGPGLASVRRAVRRVLSMELQRMSLFRKSLALGVAAAALMVAASASAASATAGVSGVAPIPGISNTMTGAGFATAEASLLGGFAQANAYEFKAGVGASAFAAATGARIRTTAAS